MAVYLALNLVVVGRGPGPVADRTRSWSSDWKHAADRQHGNPLAMVAVALLVFPKLALGLSGFETGVAVMPLVRASPTTRREQPDGPDPQHPQAADRRPR